MSILSKFVRQTTGRTIGENLGATVGQIFGGPGGAIIGEKVGGTFTEELSRRTDTRETTQPTTIPSDMGPVFGGPAQNVEIDLSGRPDTGAIMPASFRIPNLLFDGYGQQPMVQQAFAPAVTYGVGAAAGLAADFIVDLFTGEQKKMIITRKLRRDTEKLMELFNNDMDAVARELSKIKGKSYDSGKVLKILMHKFTNQGPYVTKAAVRKTRKTVRKLDSLTRLHNEICKPTTRRRATTTRRRTSAMAKASC